MDREIRDKLERETLIQDTLLEITAVRRKLQTLECVPPEEIQDSYEKVIDTLLTLLGISDKQKELLWFLATPEE